MDDVENNDKFEGLILPEIEDSSHPAAEIDSLHDLDEEIDEIEETPSLKAMLQSPDSPSRYLTILSLLFGFFALFSLVLLVFQYLKHRHAGQKPEIVIEKVKIEATITESLGEFKVSFGNAELRADLVAECSTKDACNQLRERNSEARDLTLPLLQSSSRDDILNPDKKLLLRRTIAEKLNEMKLPGKITQINISDMTVEVAH